MIARWWRNRRSRLLADYVSELEAQLARYEVAAEFIRHEGLSLRFGAYVVNRHATAPAGRRWAALEAHEARVLELVAA